MDLGGSELLTVMEAAQVMALKSSTIRKWILERRIPCVRLGKRAVRIPRSWIKEQIRAGWRDALKEGAL